MEQNKTVLFEVIVRVKSQDEYDMEQNYGDIRLFMKEYIAVVLL